MEFANHPLLAQTNTRFNRLLFSADVRSQTAPISPHTEAPRDVWSKAQIGTAEGALTCPTGDSDSVELEFLMRLI